MVEHGVAEWGGRGSLCKKGHFLAGRGTAKEKEGKERFPCRKESNGLLVKEEERPCSGRKGAGSGLGGRREGRHLDQLL